MSQGSRLMAAFFDPTAENRERVFLLRCAFSMTKTEMRLI